jgi:hypothetical protein
MAKMESTPPVKNFFLILGSFLSKVAFSLLHDNIPSSLCPMTAYLTPELEKK